MKAVTIRTLQDIKRDKQRFCCVTAYDASFARAAEAAGIETILIGDSLGMVLQGHASTLPVTVADVAYHTRCVSRAVTRPLVIADMPFMSYQASVPQAVRSAGRLVREGRAQSVGTTTAGGYLVNYEFGSGIEAARRAFGGMLSVSTVYPTQSGADLLLPTVDETGVSGSILSENASISESAMTFGQLTVSSYMYTSGLVLVSNQLLQDSEFPLDQFIANALGERLGRAQNGHWTTGTGSSQPYGVIVGAATGKTGASGQTTTVLYADLVDLAYSVDSAYRQNAKWMMKDATVAIVRKLVDGQSRPLWEPAVQMGQPDMLMGYPIVVNNDVATAAASAKSIAFGDFSKYVIRDVTGVQLVRMTERYADALQTGYYAFQRTGGRLVAANTTTYNPVKLYVHPAS
jgi:HK97 family phage major capsid protein